MSGRLFTNHRSTLRAIIDSTRVPSLHQWMQQPDVTAVYRVTCFFHDRRLRDRVATLVQRRPNGITCELAFLAAFGGRPLRYPVAPSRYENFVRTLQQIQFDRLADQPDIPDYGVDLWLAERAAGSFRQSVLLAPERAEGPHHTLVAAIKTYVPETLREMK